jgi:hypothetical protein
VVHEVDTAPPATIGHAVHSGHRAAQELEMAESLLLRDRPVAF